MRYVRLLVGPGLVLAAAMCSDGTEGPDPAPADTVAPFVTLLFPAPAAQDVPRGAMIVVTFSEPINPATVGVGSFLVRRSFDTVAGSYVFGDSSAGFEPEELLEAFAVYSVSLTRGIRDSAGNQLASDTLWGFRTASGVDTSPRR
jgi:hypothetical protein